MRSACVWELTWFLQIRIYIADLFCMKQNAHTILHFKSSEYSRSIFAPILIWVDTMSPVGLFECSNIPWMAWMASTTPSSPPSPNEKSVHYETVHSDNVQMQPSPAYESVEKKTWSQQTRYYVSSIPSQDNCVGGCGCGCVWVGGCVRACGCVVGNASLLRCTLREMCTQNLGDCS